MIEHNGKEYYPLGIGKMVKDGKIYYDRSDRQKDYFYLVLYDSTKYDGFIPFGSDRLATSDGYKLRVATDQP